LRGQLAHAFSLPLAWTASRIRFLFVYSTFARVLQSITPCHLSIG